MTATTPTTPPPWHSLPNAPAPDSVLGHRDALLDPSATLHELPLPAGADNPTPFRYLLLRDGQQVHAFVNRCAHFGVPLAARQEHLIQTPQVSITCNVHYARYRWADGVCEWGDCEGESLIPVPLDVGHDGTIRIGASPTEVPCP